MLAKYFKAMALVVVLVGMAKNCKCFFSDICIDFFKLLWDIASGLNDHSPLCQFYSDLKFLQNGLLLIKG